MIAKISGRLVAGLKGQNVLTSQNVATRKTVFICPSEALLNIVEGETLVMEETSYHIVEIRPDGTGLTELILELQA